VTTDSGLPLTYHVVEHFLGGRIYDISVPTSAETLDLSSLIIPGTTKKYKFDPVYPMGSVDDDFDQQAAAAGWLGPALTEPPAPLSVYTISALTTDYVTANISAVPELASVTIDPTSDLLYFAFMQGGATPGDSNWGVLDWIPGGPPFSTQILIGPDNGGLPLPVGQYQIWYKLEVYPQVLTGLLGVLRITS